MDRGTMRLMSTLNVMLMERVVCCLLLVFVMKYLGNSENEVTPSVSISRMLSLICAAGVGGDLLPKTEGLSNYINIVGLLITGKMGLIGSCNRMTICFD